MATKKTPPGKKTPKTKFTFDEVSGELNDRQKLFCMEYVKCKFNATEAAIKAGYAEAAARSQASYLLTNVDIQNFIGELKKDIGRAIGITAIDIALEYAKIGFSDIRKVFDENGALINIKDFDVQAAGNVSSIETYEETDREGNVLGVVKKVKLYDKVNALDKLAKMTGVDGVTKVAAVNKDGEDVAPMNDKQVETVLAEIRKIGKS